MSEACRMIPPRKGSNEDSKLFKDLLSYTNDRDLSLRAKYWSESRDAEKYHLDKDSNGEVKLEALMKRFDLTKELPVSKIINNIKRNIGTLKSDGSNKVYLTEKEVFDKASDFNKNNPLNENYVATYGRVPIGDNGEKSGFTVRVEKKTQLNSLDGKKMEINMKLNDKIKDILTSYGIGIGGLNELDKRVNATGVTDFSTATKTANGLLEIIRLAEGKKGEQALPEEFGHFIIETLDQHPLVNRLLNLLAKDGNYKEVLGDQYEQYDHLYNSNPVLLAKEAAGKLMHQGFLQSQEVKPSFFKNILDRVIAFTKSMFSSKNKEGLSTELSKSMATLESSFNSLATNVLDGTMNRFIDIDHATSHTTKLYEVADTIDKDRDSLKKIIEIETKRLSIFSARKNGQGFDDAQRIMLSKLEADYKGHKELEGIYTFVDDTMSKLKSINQRYNDLRNLTDRDSINQMASVLRDAKDFLTAYTPIFEDLSLSIQDANRIGDTRFKDKIESNFNDTRQLLMGLQDQYSELALPLLSKWLEPWVGNSLKTTWGKNKGRVRSLMEVLTEADKDIHFMDRWLNSMGDSNNSMLRLMDHAVKLTKEEGRAEHLNLEKELKGHQLVLESKGVKGNDFMFEKDENGKITGRYISKVDTRRFANDYKVFRETMNAKYPEITSENSGAYNNERMVWEHTHIDKIGGKSYPKESMYENAAFKNLTPPQREYYNKIIDIKTKLDSYLPDKYRDTYKAIQIRKDLVERLKANPSGAGKELWESIKDSIMRRADDVDLGQKKGAQTDFNGEVIKFLPIYYTHMLEDTHSISTDVTSTMTAYAAMAIDFDKMNKVIDTLELSRDLAKNMDITQNKKGKPIVEKFNSMGRTIENKVTNKGDNSRIIERLNDFFDMQVYGHYNKDQGSVNILGKEIDVAKAASTFNRVTSLSILGGNALSAGSHIGRGIAQLGIDAVSGEHFNLKNVAVADKNLSLLLPSLVSNIGTRVKTDKLSLINEKFNVMQDYEQHARDLKMDRNSGFSKLMGTNSLFFLNNAGVYWMQNRPTLSLMDAYKLVDSKGVQHSLFDSYEVKPIIKDGLKVGATLELKDGYKKLDGTDFTQKDVTDFTLKAGKITNKMFGAYNKSDMNAFQHHAVGRLVSMFRKFMVQSYNRRFESHNFDYDIQAEQEGYYATSANFLKTLYQDVKHGQLHLATHWNELAPQERMNMMKSMTEVGTFIALSTALGLITFSTDKDRPWAAKMLEYEMKRLHLEMGSMIPINYQFPKEAMKLLTSPAASIDYVNKILELGNFAKYGKVYKSGKYKDHSGFYKDVMDLLPTKNAIEKSIHPELGINWFKAVD